MTEPATGRPQPPLDDWGHEEADLLTGVHQLMLLGKRSGEGYFGPDGRMMVFQAEREPDNPFYQIYLLDRATGDVRRVSPGWGKTTCAWIHPTEAKVLFASTHADPEARRWMAEEFEARASGAPRSQAAWDYDPCYDLYEVEIGGDDYRRLTDWHGYTAEASWSPDGQRIAFACNRRGFEGGLSEEESRLFSADPSVLMDIYVMNADGSGVRRLTGDLGYDGGPFFSPDGERIVWRRFNREGTVAEIWTMRADGGDQRPLTALGAMSWAPFFHPSGDYVIFTTNRHGFRNFELYMVDSAGEGLPVRVTFTDGPDVLPVFTPDGGQLAWVTRRGDGSPQIHLGAWSDATARRLLGLPPTDAWPRRGFAPPDPEGAGLPPIDPAAVRRHVEQLASERMSGRMTGTPGEAAAVDYVEAAFRAAGLEPAGEDGYRQHFAFTSAVSLDGANALLVEEPGGGRPRSLAMDDDWRPLALSRTGPVDFAPLVFVGYGIVAPAEGAQASYDSYGSLDVAGKWALVLRYVPENVAPERRQYLSRFGSLRYKAMEARDRGAIGLVVVTGPGAEVKEELVALRFDGTVAGASIAAVSVANDVCAAWLAPGGQDLAALQADLDGGEPRPGFELPGTRLAARIGLRFEESSGCNVLGRLRVAPEPTAQVVVLGAHLDHLGRGERGNSLARADESGQVHPGADDNASGVAGLLEIARHLGERLQRGRLTGLRRDVLCAAWSGEELGLLGSSHFVRQRTAGETSLARDVAACLNLDMIGRLERTLSLQGVASSPFWRPAIERHNIVAGLPLTLGDDTYLPTDATAFYLKGVPILSAFTGTYGEHHSPRDRPELLSYDGLARVAALIEELVVDLSAAERAPEHTQVAAPKGRGGRTSRVYLGTIPDFSQTSGRGVLLSGVSAGGPAQTAGLQAGDRVVELAGQPLESIYDYMRVMDACKIGRTVGIVVERDGRSVALEITPGSRE